jgi:hypothetical protein
MYSPKSKAVTVSAVLAESGCKVVCRVVVDGQNANVVVEEADKARAAKAAKLEAENFIFQVVDVLSISVVAQMVQESRVSKWNE